MSFLCALSHAFQLCSLWVLFTHLYLQTQPWNLCRCWLQAICSFIPNNTMCRLDFYLGSFLLLLSIWARHQWCYALFTFLKKLIWFVWMFCLCVYLWTSCVPGAHGDQKRAAGLLDLKFQTVVSWDSNWIIQKRTSSKQVFLTYKLSCQPQHYFS